MAPVVVDRKDNSLADFANVISLEAPHKSVLLIHGFPSKNHATRLDTEMNVIAVVEVMTATMKALPQRATPLSSSRVTITCTAYGVPHPSSEQRVLVAFWRSHDGVTNRHGDVLKLTNSRSSGHPSA